MNIKTLALFATGFLAVSAVAAGAIEAPSNGSMAMGRGAQVQDAAANSQEAMQGSWEQDRDGGRCRTRTAVCSHHYNGYWYQTAWWTMPMSGGASMMNMGNTNSDTQYNRDNNQR